MKLLCLSVVVFCLVSSLEASPGPIFDNKPIVKYAFQSLNKFFSLFTEKENFVSTQHRQRRQANQRCMRDIQETQGQHFRACNQVLQTFGDGTISANGTDMFCRQRCPGYLISLADRLDRDCDFPDALDPNMKAFLNQSCDMGPNHKSCLTLWNNVTQQLASNTSTAAVSYSKCINENKINSKICNPDCKNIEVWIESNLGCCYKALVDYYRALGVTDELLSDDNWDICNVKEPDTCTQVAPTRPPPPFTRGPPRTPPPRTRGPPMN